MCSQPSIKNKKKLKTNPKNWVSFVAFEKKNRKRDPKNPRSGSSSRPSGFLWGITTWDPPRSDLGHPLTVPAPKGQPQGSASPHVLQDRDGEQPHTPPTVACGLPAAGSVPAQCSTLLKLMLHPNLLLRHSVEEVPQESREESFMNTSPSFVCFFVCFLPPDLLPSGQNTLLPSSPPGILPSLRCLPHTPPCSQLRLP